MHSKPDSRVAAGVHASVDLFGKPDLVGYLWRQDSLWHWRLEYSRTGIFSCEGTEAELRQALNVALWAGMGQIVSLGKPPGSRENKGRK